MNKYLITSILVASAFCVRSQTISQTLISPSGSYTANENIKLHWSVGELSIQSYDTDINLTEGFYQPSLIIILNNKTSSSLDLILELYPNPTSDYLIIQHDEKLHYNLYSLQGQLIRSGIIGPENEKIHVNNLIDGTYLIRFNNPSGKFSTKKFIKTSL